MTTEATAPLQIDGSLIGSLELENADAPYVNLQDQPFIHTRLRVGETEYTYDRSYPIKGHSATLPGAIADLQSEGRRLLVAERNDRYYLYVA